MKNPTTKSIANAALAAVCLLLIGASAHCSAEGQATGLTDNTSPVAGAESLEFAETNDQWRKTTHGWEWIEPQDKPIHLIQMHPLVLAAMQVLAPIAIWLVHDLWRERPPTSHSTQTAHTPISPITDARLSSH